MPNWFGPDPTDCGCCSDYECPDISIEISGVGGSTGCTGTLTCSNLNGTYLVSSVSGPGCIFEESCVSGGNVYANNIYVSYDANCGLAIRVWTYVRPLGIGTNAVSFADFTLIDINAAKPSTLTPTSTGTAVSYSGGASGFYACDLDWGSVSGTPSSSSICDLSSMVVKLV